MELDVHLRRTIDEYWGFELIGGADCGIPLTIVKVQPSSPAYRAGLRDTDIILRLNGEDASDLKYNDARRTVAECGDTLDLLISRGLYDPVLDESEPVIDLQPEDFDQPSTPPTEVFQIQTFDPIKEPENRSLTASPFVPNTKPYRPFSTEPLEVPPLEDPIILNPEYRDDFRLTNVEEDVFSSLFGDIKVEAKYKLPINKKYDPDAAKKLIKQEEVLNNIALLEESICKQSNNSQKDVSLDGRSHLEVKSNKSLNESSSQFNLDTVYQSMNSSKNTKEEIQFYDSKTEKLTKDFVFEQLTKERVGKDTYEDLEIQQIAETAILLVDDSINRAISVTDEIKNEIGVELCTYYDSSEVTSDSIKSKEFESVEHNIQKSYNNETKTIVKDFENIIVEDNRRNEERKQSIQQEIQNTIEAGSVRQKTEIFSNDSEVKSIDIKSESQKAKSIKIKNDECKRSENTDVKNANTRNTHKSSEQRVYSLGLQTIPNIKGSLHSSCQYDLLLKTFFIHLTDVMVALSRFVLSEPATKNPDRLNVSQSVFKSSESNHAKESYKKAQCVKTDFEMNERKDQTEYTDQNQARHVERSKTTENEKEINTETKSGAKMSQLCERKTEALTHKMDAVISEFQSKSTEQFDTCSNRSSRSRSRSRIEEEVMSDSDPLDWLEKHEKTSFTHTEAKRTDTKHESSKTKTHKSRPSKQTYLAVVESHVYTNKDAILEDYAAEISETASVHSAEEINIAKQSIETMSIEKAAMEHVSELKKAIVIEEHPPIIKENSLCIAIAESTEVNVESKSEELTIENVKVENAISSMEDNYSSAKKEIVATYALAEDKEINTDVKETKIFNSEQYVSETAHTTIEENYNSAQMSSVQSMAFAKSTDLNMEVSETSTFDSKKIETSEAKITSTEELSTVKQTQTKSLALAKSGEIITEVNQANTFDQQELKTELASATLEEDYTQTVAVHKPNIQLNTDVTIDEKLTLKASPEKTLDEQSAALKIVKYQVIGEGESVHMTNDTEIEIREDFELKKLQETAEVHSESYSRHEAMKSSYSSESKLSSEISLSQSEVAKLSVSSKIGSISAISTHNGDLTKVLNTQLSIESDENNNTSNPPTVPATPVTDEYVFKLEIPLPKSRGTTPIPRDISPEKDEDPHIVKKRLMPHIETTIESVVYDQPLPTPPEDKPSSPVFTKPGLKGGSVAEFKEEIREIERKSSLLASAIDETIKSIEEYKESIGMKSSEEFASFKTEHSTTKAFSGHTVTKAKSNPIAEIKMNGFSNIEDDNLENGSDTPNYTIEDNLEKSKSSETVEDVKTENLTKYITTFDDTKVKEKEQDTEIKTVNSVAVPYDLSEIKTVVTGALQGSETNTAVPETEYICELTPEKIERPIKNFVKIFPTDVEESVICNGLIEKKPSDWKSEELEGFRPVHFDPDAPKGRCYDGNTVQEPLVEEHKKMYMTPDGELMGTVQGIVDGLENAMVDQEVAKALGKPGMPEEKIAELISGEAEMLREAHVMGLTRVLSSHMHRPDDSSVDFNKIKPIVESLKDSEVIKALNEELLKKKAEEKKKDKTKVTTFLQKPKRPVPRIKFGYHGYVEKDEDHEEPYKVQIVKQPKPKVAPDYKPKDFETGPLPWEERAELESSLPPVEPEEPILVPEDTPQFLEAVDPLPESEVPDLEDTGIPLPEPAPVTLEEEAHQEEGEEEPEAKEEETLDLEAVVAETEDIVVEMEQNRMANQLLGNIQNMIDPNAPIDQQLAQMRQQLAALAQLPGVIQQTLEHVSKQFTQLSQMESVRMRSQSEVRTESSEDYTDGSEENQQTQNIEPHENRHVTSPEPTVTIEEIPPTPVAERNGEVMLVPTAEELEKMRQEEQEMRRMEQQKKVSNQNQLDQESRMVKQRPTPRVGKPKRVFGPLSPEERPIVLPGGRKWRGPKDAYNDQIFAEAMQAQAELIQGKTLGSFESDLLPYDERVNFMKYEKPPVSLDHLQRSEVLRMIQSQDDPPRKRVELLTPVIAEADYRERVRSLTPNGARGVHFNLPQQLEP